jgi:hypothetical protein
MPNVEKMRELTNEEINMVAGGQTMLLTGVQEGVSDIDAGAQAIRGGHINTGLGLIAEGVMDIHIGQLHFGPRPR